MNVTRAQVLAYRSAMHGLAGDPPDDALLDLGVQDTPAGSAALALSARGLDATGLTPVWTFRGAPHLHRTSDLPGLPAALWPLSEADASARLAGFGSTLRKAELSAVEAIAATAAAVRAVVKGTVSKGDLSAGVTERVPDAYSYACRSCRATHVFDQLLRVSSVHGGVRLASSQPVTFAPMSPRPPQPKAARGTDRLVRAYLTVHGPATRADAGGFLGSTGKHVEPAWPEGLAEVTLAGRKAWLPESHVDLLRDAAAPEGVRLLPPSDPFLQARDRDLLVPDKARAKTLWTVLAGPGAVLAGGDVAGTWRAKQGPKGRLDVTVTEWRRVPKAAVEREAARVAAARGAADVAVSYA